MMATSHTTAASILPTGSTGPNMPATSIHAPLTPVIQPTMAVVATASAEVVCHATTENSVDCQPSFEVFCGISSEFRAGCPVLCGDCPDVGVGVGAGGGAGTGAGTSDGDGAGAGDGVTTRVRASATAPVTSLPAATEVAQAHATLIPTTTLTLPPPTTATLIPTTTLTLPTPTTATTTQPPTTTGTVVSQSLGSGRSSYVVYRFTHIDLVWDDIT